MTAAMPKLSTLVLSTEFLTLDLPTIWVLVVRKRSPILILILSAIKNYMENVVREARDKGYVETLFHRRREIPDINSRNFNVRGFAERTAINSPIQGSAADILKIAMIRLDQALTDRNFKTRMLLQVHDEIVLEVPENELTAIKTLVKDIMESAIELSVPLKADESAGKTWYEAK